MDFAGLSSSPPALRSSLPPSSAPFPSHPTNGSSPGRPVQDALALGDDEAEEETQDTAGGRRRRRQKGNAADVPIVKDAVGESVADSFETFLKTCAIYFYGQTVFNIWLQIY